METIRQLLERFAPERYMDKGLAWGARASAYRDEIVMKLATGFIPVLVELENDTAWHPPDLIVLDHHGSSGGMDVRIPLEAIGTMLGLKRNDLSSCERRQFDLVRANDKGHITEMLHLDPPATLDELHEVRRLDRKCQGITPEEEEVGRAALSQAEFYAGGRLTVLQSFPHDRTAVATDFLHPTHGGCGYQNLLIIGPQQIHFFGEGQIVSWLAERWPTGSYGGCLPEAGFWVTSRSWHVDSEEVIHHLAGQLIAPILTQPAECSHQSTTGGNST